MSNSLVTPEWSAKYKKWLENLPEFPFTLVLENSRRPEGWNINWANPIMSTYVIEKRSVIVRNQEDYNDTFTTLGVRVHGYTFPFECFERVFNLNIKYVI